MYVAKILHLAFIPVASHAALRSRAKVILAFFLLTVMLLGCRQDRQTALEHFNRATELEAQKDLSGAVLELKALLIAEPDNREARWQLGHLYVRLGFAEGALKELTRAQNLGLVNEEVTRFRLHALLMTKAYPAVLEELQRDNLMYPIQHLEFEAQARFGLGQFDQAKKLFEQVLDVRPQRQPPLFKLGLIAKYQGQLAAAEQYFNNVIQLNPEYSSAWFYKADIRLRHGDLQGASAAYQQVLQQQPGQIGASLGLVQVALAQGDNASADVLLAPLTKRYPDYSNINYLFALSALQRDDLKEAKSTLIEILQRAPDDMASLLLLGATFYQQGDYPAALLRLLQAVKSDDKYTAAYRLLAATHLGMKAPKKAVGILLLLVETWPEDIQLRGLLAEALARQGEYDKARNELAQAGKLVMQGRVHSVQIEVSNLAYGETEARVSEGFSAVTLQAKHSGAALVAIMVDLIKQRYEQALQGGLVLLADTDSPDNPMLLEMLGATYEGMGSLDKAQVMYEKSLLLAPDYGAARSALNRIKIKKG